MFTIPITAELKYAVHVVIFISWIVGFEFFCNSFAFTDTAIDTTNVFDPVERYGTTITLVLYLLRLFSLLVLPQCICNALGLLLFNGFKEKVELKNAPIFSPFVCFRVVTRGDYPALIKENLTKNRQICYEAGIENFMFEVVTDKQLGLELDARVREIVVPTTYRTKTGAKFKARALQFCLEDRVSEVRDEDWVVHLDEETLLTTNSVRGILNFCADGKHQFGQGVITYAHGHILNWLTTLSDSFRVADDIGKLHFQLSIFHKPLFAWKGSFVVTKVEAERKVNWDHGLEGSLAEDCFFSMIAFRDGYSFDFIDGEMHEKSPFTIWDFLQQRKRWLQGIFFDRSLESNSNALQATSWSFSLCMDYNAVYFTSSCFVCNCSTAQISTDRRFGGFCCCRQFVHVHFRCCEIVFAQIQTKCMALSFLHNWCFTLCSLQHRH
ncbi:hypothetical protein M3Y94_00312000 [Aphelenchoides besseyi]|nr:hypothetical protein M3Y94_00312000 [Aphelenchoides besseyi]